MSLKKAETARRTGDAIAIPGDYQYRAATTGSRVQRFWHFTKKLAIQQYLPPKAGDFVADAGCGSGVISAYLGECGAQVLGIDNNPGALAFARDRFGSERVQFHQGLVDEHLILERPLDKLYCLEVLEHIYPPQGLHMLRIFHDLLHPGGAVFLTTPNYHSMWPAVEWLLDRFTGAAGMAGEQHVSRYHPAALRSIAEQAGFQVESLVTVSFLAPWFAPLSWKLARALHRLDTRLPAFCGCICVTVLRKPTRGPA
jgi:2-polyprenyl-3-methyl-5-hydroxy-6-metoxy-1,4-benzoquinol methylase